MDSEDRKYDEDFGERKEKGREDILNILTLKMAEGIDRKFILFYAFPLFG